MKSLSRLQIFGILLLFRGTVDAQNSSHNRGAGLITGVFSSLILHAESQDVIGYEITVSKVGDKGVYFVVLQCAQGVAEPPIVSRAEVVSGMLTFSPEDHACGSKFRAMPGSKGILLWIDGRSQGLIPRHHSFWETH
ncbi:MAG: hypothetical protein JWQ42_975 [Edaphobacter sp.]|nr:hypothetical protein [Edaphobacter sp.]MCU1318656.1 hypothetical protein [Edaphobacter sp.]